MVFLEHLEHIQNIKESLEKVASKWNIDKSFLDFEITSMVYQLHYEDKRVIVMSKEDFIQEGLGLLKNEQIVQIRELYDLSIYRDQGFKESRCFAIGVTADKMKAAIEVKKEIDFPNPKKTFKKYLAYNGILSVFSTSSIVALAESKALHVGRRTTLTHSLIATTSKPGEVRYYFDPKVVEGSIVQVDVNQKLFEIVHPVVGESGRDLFGTLIIAPKYDDIASNYSYNTETIYFEDDTATRVFYAKVQGRLYFKNNHLDVETKMVINNTDVNFAKSLGDDRFNGVSVEVIEDRIQYDGIKTGTQLTTSRVDSKGFVGKNVSINSEVVTINNQTHISTTINTDVATISSLKGNLNAVVAQVEQMLYAHVKTEELHGGFALGSTIESDNIQLEELKNNNSIKVYDSITINEVTGEYNTLSAVFQDTGKLNKEQETLECTHQIMEKNKEMFGSKLRFMDDKVVRLNAKIGSGVILSVLEKRTLSNAEELNKKIRHMNNEITNMNRRIHRINRYKGEGFEIRLASTSGNWGKDNKIEVILPNEERFFYITNGRESGSTVIIDKERKLIKFA